MSKFNESLNEFNKDEVNELRKQNRQYARELQKLNDELVVINKTLEVADTIVNTNIKPPKWLAPAKPSKSAVTLVAMLSDTHFDEVVVPEEVDGLNAYNREIALMRLKKWSQGIIKMSRHYLSGVTYDGMVLVLGGDIFSGDIHEELAETNEDTILGSVLYWAEQLCGAIDMFESEFGKVHVVSVVGNHGRMSRKPRAKLRVRTNFDWLLSKMIERHYHDNTRVTFQIPESADCLVNIYGHGHLITHGDQVTGGGGIGGIYPPIMRLRARKAQRYLATGKSFQTLWMGHWHQYISTPSLIINGSLKGYDEYAMISNFSFEPPQQALAVVTPSHNVTIQAPIFVEDRKKEGW